MQMRYCRRRPEQAKLAAAIAAVALLGAACGTTASAAAKSAAPAAASKAMTEYVGGHWVPFSSAKPLSAAQWAVVDGYANFSSAALAVYSTRSTAPLATVVLAQSKVTAMFARDLAAGKNPEALYTKATVEAAAIHGCRASVTLELYYPGGRSLHYVSSWVRPFDRAGLAHTTTKGVAGSTPPQHSGSLAALAFTQYAPWQFVGDSRLVGLSCERDHSRDAAGPHGVDHGRVPRRYAAIDLAGSDAAKLTTGRGVEGALACSEQP